MERYVRRIRLSVPPQEAFAWHARPGAFQRLTPPFGPVRSSHDIVRLAEGTEVRLSLRGWPWPLWTARHTVVQPPHEFVDEQVTGPFASWRHRHGFEPAPGGGTVLTDDVAYRLPLGALGRRSAGARVQAELDRLFAYRQRVTAADLEAHAAARRRGVSGLHVAITGASGLVGRALTAFLSAGGHRVTPIVRRPPARGEVSWHPEAGRIDVAGLRGVDAVVHLAGEPIATAGHSRARRDRVLRSRERGTQLLATALAELDDGPRTLVTASGIGYYGDRGDDLLTEDAPPGAGFLAEVCVRWEAAAAPAAAAGVRVVHLRTGVVQTPAGGALARQAPLFRLGVGGRIGSGRQWLSWISLDDLLGLYHLALTTPGLSGPLNATSPQPATNAHHAATLGRVLGRPARLAVPKPAVRLALGALGEELVLYSQRVSPARAVAAGYAFRHPDLAGCLRDVLGQAPR